MEIREPTGDECNEKAIIYENDKEICRALWFPQMGGYSGKAVAVITKRIEGMDDLDGGCVEVYVWHDGEFPFKGDSSRPPYNIHLCDPDQFIGFGNLLSKWNNEA